MEYWGQQGQINEHNESGVGPIVETAPLPARAQFLNVIESVFSDMARSIIHNSDYRSRYLSVPPVAPTQ
jgi:hypothetical protein